MIGGSIDGSGYEALDKVLDDWKTGMYSRLGVVRMEQRRWNLNDGFSPVRAGV